MVEESFSSFIELSCNLRDQLETARAEKEVAEELKQSLEAKLEKSIADVFNLQKELKSMQDKMAEAEAKLKKKKLLLDKKLIKELKQKVDEAMA